MNEFDCDLLVIGLGPTGDILSILARMQGLTVIAIDREPAPYPLPRAAVFDHEIMRIFQMAGVADRIEPLCRVPDRYQFLTATGEVLLDFPISPEGPYGWAETYALHQPAVEQALRARLAELDVDIRLSTTLAGLRQDANSVTVETSGPSGPQTIRARFAVGCDGAWSSVREALGIVLSDYVFDEPWLVLDTIIEEPGDLPKVCQQICDPARPVTHLAMSGNRFRWEFMLKPGETPAEMVEDSRIRELLEPWDCADRVMIERKAVYRFHGLVADRWRVGRVFIAGDAAHQMPPFAGQGMCSGIRDAANLAWKLAISVHSDAPTDLLDSYQTEREPHVRSIIETAIAMGRVVCLIDEQAAAARNEQMLARKATGEQDVSVQYPPLKGGVLLETAAAGALFPQPIAGRRFDELLGLSGALVGRELPALDNLPLVGLDLDSPALRPFAAEIDSWLAEHGASAVLIRPDRHVFGVGPPALLLQQWNSRLRLREAA